MEKIKRSELAQQHWPKGAQRPLQDDVLSRVYKSQARSNKKSRKRCTRRRTKKKVNHRVRVPRPQMCGPQISLLFFVKKSSSTIGVSLRSAGIGIAPGHLLHLLLHAARSAVFFLGPAALRLCSRPWPRPRLVLRAPGLGAPRRFAIAGLLSLPRRSSDLSLAFFPLGSLLFVHVAVLDLGSWNNRCGLDMCRCAIPHCFDILRSVSASNKGYVQYTPRGH
jgi:hypothetical protein